MHHFLTKSIKFNERLISVCVHDRYVYCGGSGKELYRLSKDLMEREIVSSFKKSIRHVSQYEQYLGCASYDGTAKVFKNNAYFDVVEGPETEIKSIHFNTKECALATRGKEVWVLNIDDVIEVDNILEDHTQDVKGVVFIYDRMLSYGYDTTIKVYERAMYADEKYELIENITDHKSTVWSVISFGDVFFSSDHDGYIFKYTIGSDETYELQCVQKASFFPICQMKKINDCTFAYICNKRSLNIVDLNFKLIHTLENVSSTEINYFDFCPITQSLYIVEDSGYLHKYDIIFDSNKMEFNPQNIMKSE